MTLEHFKLLNNGFFVARMRLNRPMAAGAIRKLGDEHCELLLDDEMIGSFKWSSDGSGELVLHVPEPEAN